MTIRFSGFPSVRADIHACNTCTALLLHRITGRVKRRTGKNGNPPDPGAIFLGDNQAVLTSPAESCEVGCEFLGEYAADVLIVRQL